jgi:hypothetical protein
VFLEPLGEFHIAHLGFLEFGLEVDPEQRRS